MVKPINIRNQNLIRKTKHKKHIIKQILFYVMLTVFLGATIYVLFFSSLMLMTHIEIEGNKNITKQPLLNQVNSQLSGKYLKLFSKNNFLFVNNKKIENNLLAKFTMIREVKVKKNFPSQLKINILERIPTMTICDNSQCYVLDENGQVYDNASQIFKKKLIVLTDENNRKINFGDIILNKNYMNYIVSIKKRVEEETNLILKNNFRTPSIISNDIRAKTQEGWEIYFNKNISLDKEIEELKVILNKKINQKQRPDLEYIDLRINNKIYYKFRDGTPEAIAQQKITAEQAALSDTSTIKKKDIKKKK